jgi:hypothetical protein
MCSCVARDRASLPQALRRCPGAQEKVMKEEEKFDQTPQGPKASLTSLRCAKNTQKPLFIEYFMNDVFMKASDTRGRPRCFDSRNPMPAWSFFRVRAGLHYAAPVGLLCCLLWSSW